jgi:general secretion pathway protein K
MTRRRPERGATLLVVTVAVTLVTAAAVDLAYQARVSLEIAANGRDALRAEGLARGSVALSRLVLHFQGQLDQATARTGAALGALGGAQAGQAGAAQAAAAAMPKIQIWKLVPIDSALVANLFGGGTGDGEAASRARPARGGDQAGPAPRPPPSDAGDLAGHFDATIDDEDRKVNVQFDALTAALSAQVQSFDALVGDHRWDFLFDREDQDGVRFTRGDVAIHLRDWTDADQQQSSLTGNPANPFETGFGDENFYYDRGADRYKAKNARFDSLEELHEVAGISDEFMAAFGDQLTVYVDKNGQMNINADTRGELVTRARIMADPPNQPLLSDPTFPERLEKAVTQVRMGGFLSIGPQQFAALLEGLGLGVSAAYRQASSTSSAFTDRSLVYRIRGHARVGKVDQTIDAVVTFDPSHAREEATQLGRLLHWHVE